jgi:hypothetical protein
VRCGVVRGDEGRLLCAFAEYEVCASVPRLVFALPGAAVHSLASAVSSIVKQDTRAKASDGEMALPCKPARRGRGAEREGHDRVSRGKSMAWQMGAGDNREIASHPYSARYDARQIIPPKNETDEGFKNSGAGFAEGI